MNKTILLAMLFAFSSTSPGSWAPDRVSLAYGHFLSPFADRHAEIDQYRLGLAWNLSDALWSSDSLLLQSYGELAFGQWQSRLNPVEDHRRIGADSVQQISLSPVVRFTIPDLSLAGAAPFIDLGVGLSYQSEGDIEQQHLSGINMGGNWQFEIRTMVGLNLGPGNPFAVSYGWMHYSNAYLSDANEGMDFQTLQLSYAF